jgi:cysteinyl-tRNA synthetase, unknown class
MKKNNILLFAAFAIIFCNCKKNDEEDNAGDTSYRQSMRKFVQNISSYAKAKKSGFIVIPQNGQELVTENGEEDGIPVTEYLNAIDGVGREDLFYGYSNDDQATPTEDRNYMISFLNICKNNQVIVLTTDYCWTHSKMDDSYQQNNTRGYISFAAPDRNLQEIPDYPQEPYKVNTGNISKLSEAKNFLYLLNPEQYATKQAFLSAIDATNYDVFIIDYFFNEEEFTVQEITQLKTKQNGGQRLVIAYMSIGEAENYRYYWNSDWVSSPPSWLKEENPDWKGNYKVEYWNTEWQNIIYGNSNAYLDKILSKGFDGVYLDIIDAFEYFE